MCGIYGAIDLSDLDHSKIQSSLSKLQHRGPDDQGIYIKNNFAIGMCRLAINELESGHQPFLNHQDGIGVVFNGEIYNYKELGASEGLSLHTSEAALIGHLFLKYGVDFVKILDGMFAIAIADFNSKNVYLFRDPFGKKPLWVLRNPNGSLEFASEIKAFSSNKSIRQEFVSEYLTFGYIPFNKSPYIEIEAIPAGSYLIWSKDSEKLEKYWHLGSNLDKKISYKKSKLTLEKLLTDAVRKRLVSERPIGVYLSGGYDSSIIAAFMKETSDSAVNSFTIGFKDSGFDESKYAEQISNHLGLNHHQMILDIDIEAVVIEAFGKIDMPFADSSLIPTFLLNKFASEDVVVALAGDGGDEIFAGYDRYFITPLLSKFAFVFRLVPAKLWGNSRIINQINRKLKRLREESIKEGTLGYRFLNLMSLVKSDKLKEIVRYPDFSSLDKFAKNLDNIHASKLRKMLIADIDTYLYGDLLVKADLASMFNSVEVRSPMLDKKMAEFVFTLPDKFLLKGVTKKRILKDIAHERLPKKIMKRPKMGFGVPMAEWLRSDLKDLMFRTLNSNRKILDCWLYMDKVEELVQKHLQGEDHSRTIWPIIALSLWVENRL